MRRRLQRPSFPPHSPAPSMSLLPSQEERGDYNTCDDYNYEDRMLIPRHMRITERVAVVCHLRANRVNNVDQLDYAQKPGGQQKNDGNYDSHRSPESHEHPKASNARHHPPAQAIDDNSRAVAG